ncbi:hypothetical protein [Treponema sp. R6D11]
MTHYQLLRDAGFLYDFRDADYPLSGLPFRATLEQMIERWRWEGRDAKKTALDLFLKWGLNFEPLPPFYRRFANTPLDQIILQVPLREIWKAYFLEVHPTDVKGFWVRALWWGEKIVEGGEGWFENHPWSHFHFAEVLAVLFEWMRFVHRKYAPIERELDGMNAWLCEKYGSEYEIKFDEHKIYETVKGEGGDENVQKWK